MIFNNACFDVFEQDEISAKTRTPEKIYIEGGSLSKGPELRKRMASPSTRRPRRKRRRGNKDSMKENFSSSNLRLFSPTSSDQKEEYKQNAAISNFPGGSILSTTKQMPTSTSQNLFSFPDGSTPRKTQTRRRIRSQSKLSDLLTSSSNESLLSNK